MTTRRSLISASVGSAVYAHMNSHSQSGEGGTYFRKLNFLLDSRFDGVSLLVLLDHTLNRHFLHAFGHDRVDFAELALYFCYGPLNFIYVEKRCLNMKALKEEGVAMMCDNLMRRTTRSCIYPSCILMYISLASALHNLHARSHELGCDTLVHLPSNWQ